MPRTSQEENVSLQRRLMRWNRRDSSATDERDGGTMIGTRRLRTREGAGVYQSGRDRIAQILDVVLDEDLERGYEAMTLREVARRCKVQIGAISHYYRSRSDLLQDVLREPALGVVGRERDRLSGEHRDARVAQAQRHR